ncbi:AT-hook motif nuclear-localized protein 1 [Sesamum angolense]|uniref:AT-hook motif nuclear-localized protein n=1 Tax=Sesamum angolense TaxID=2727404 RepID=A0AAE1W9V3_9LAMI|nr:AT-hook motif nuclear-localized protein 1 [Sesamum angolense]
MEGTNTLSSSGVTVVGSDAPSEYHVAPRTTTENPPEVTGSASLAITVSPVPVSGAPPPSGAAGVGGDTTLKKKRGRPRKYGPDGSVGMALSPKPISSSAPPPVIDFSAVGKRGKVRSVGSGVKLQQLRMENEGSGEWVSCSVGANFTPHIITVNAGELNFGAKWDTVTVLILLPLRLLKSEIHFCIRQGPRAICVLSANGVVSSVTLRQPDSSGGTLTYESFPLQPLHLCLPKSSAYSGGPLHDLDEQIHILLIRVSVFGILLQKMIHYILIELSFILDSILKHVLANTIANHGRFEILSLSGSFMPSETGGMRNRSGGMSVSLASPDGRVVGGGVAGLLVAAIVIGSFLAGNQLEKKKNKPESMTIIPAAPIPVPNAVTEDTYNTSSSFRGDSWSSFPPTQRSEQRLMLNLIGYSSFISDMLMPEMFDKLNGEKLTWFYVLICCYGHDCSDVPMAQFIINMNAALPQSQKFIIHVLDNTHIFVRSDVAGMIRSAIATFREQNTYEKPS